MEPKDLNEALKKAEHEGKLAQHESNDGVMKLDDTQRVKVLSPGRLVTKRFLRNKLAIVGSSILIFMFVFCFIGPFLYPYHQTEKFYKIDILENDEFGSANNIVDYGNFKLADAEAVDKNILSNISRYIISDMVPNDLTFKFINDKDGNLFLLKYETNNVYSLSDSSSLNVATLANYIAIGEYDAFQKDIIFAEGITLGEDFKSAAIAAIDDSLSEFEFDGKTYLINSLPGKKYSIKLIPESPFQYASQSLGEEFEAAVLANKDSGMFEFDGENYKIDKIDNDTYNIGLITIGNIRYIHTLYTVNLMNEEMRLKTDFLIAAHLGLISDGEFSYDNDEFTIREENDKLNIYLGDELYGEFSRFSVHRADGSGALPIEFKKDIEDAVNEMLAKGKDTITIVTKVEKQNADESIARDESGRIIYEDTEVTIINKIYHYEIRCDRINYLIDTKAKPGSPKSQQYHLLGTDVDGYDVLSRMMYGGRVSLLVGFVVVIIETIIGVILGGISGYFSGWIDTLIMRLVDIFNCIPTMPILIIIGAYFDKAQLDATSRLMWMMAILGFLGWSGVARLVRGQILSLREQEFMLATEVGGLKVSRRIFRHLVPNVMPQLIVNATAGLGGVILTESVLSFLGLGVKHPLASWGSMINSVSDASNMIELTYIWIPVGIFICLTVIAFNFVGDGLRDAFDPKMKR